MSAATPVTIQCEKCGVSLTLPEMAASDLDKITSLVREDRHAEATTFLRDRFALSLAAAKAIEMHITRKPGICVRCRAALTSRGQVTCHKCRSLNLNW